MNRLQLAGKTRPVLSSAEATCPSAPLLGVQLRTRAKV